MKDTVYSRSHQFTQSYVFHPRPLFQTSDEFPGKANRGTQRSYMYIAIEQNLQHTHVTLNLKTLRKVAYTLTIQLRGGYEMVSE